MSDTYEEALSAFHAAGNALAKARDTMRQIEDTHRAMVITLDDYYELPFPKDVHEQAVRNLDHIAAMRTYHQQTMTLLGLAHDAQKEAQL